MDENSSEEIYRLGREALARGAFGTAARLFRLLESEPKWEGDSRFAFNLAQASRYVNDVGEAVYWYGRYLALEPNATDARAVREQMAKLVASSPKSVRAAALSRARAAFAKVAQDPELDRVLVSCPRVSLVARFYRPGDASGPASASAATAFLYNGRAIAFEALGDETSEKGWRLWVVPTAPIAAPEEIGAPPYLFLPPGRVFPLDLDADDMSRPSVITASAPPGLPPDPDLAVWRVEVSAQIEKAGPPVLVTLAGGKQLFEVRSGPLEGPVAVAKRRRDFPFSFAPISFGPRATRSDGKVFPKVPFLVVDLPGKEGAVERWGAPLAWFEVTNRFGKVDAAATPARFYARTEATGPYLLALPGAASPR